jgi:uncharacterized protein (DUF952 family)
VNALFDDRPPTGGTPARSGEPDEPSPEPVLHVMAAGDWLAAQEDGLVSRRGAPFLHLCTLAQLPGVLGRHYPGVTGLVALTLDPDHASVAEHLVWEAGDPPPPEGPDTSFPHLYADLPVTWVTSVAPIDGTAG